jgi:hypothetical protein
VAVARDTETEVFLVAPVDLAEAEQAVVLVAPELLLV